MFVRGTHGFGNAYPKRAPKLLVGRSQTLLSYAVGGSIHTDNCYVSIFIFCSFNCLCGCLSTDLSLANFSKKRKHYFADFSIFLPLFHSFAKSPLLETLKLFHTVENPTFATPVSLPHPLTPIHSNVIKTEHSLPNSLLPNPTNYVLPITYCRA